MCGRYTLYTNESEEEFQERFDLEEPYALSSRYNVAPTQGMPVVVVDGKRHVVLMKWGLVPKWHGGGKGNYSMINARAESVNKKPFFRRSLLFHRCIVPASGFYEWKRVGEHKMPYYIHLKSGELFGFAGLYDTWRDGTGREIKTYTIITTQPNKTVRGIHDRMPVILKKEDEAKWLDPDIVELERLTAFLVPYPDASMEAYPVSTLVNSPKNDTVGLVKPLSI